MVFTGNFINDILGSVLEALIPNLGELVDIGETIHNERKKENQTFKIINKAKSSGNLSEDIYDKLHEDSKGIGLVEFDLISTAVKTNKWINYAIWCMCDEESVILKADKDARELINGIAEMAGYTKIYQSTGSADLFKYAIENEDRDIGSKFILSIEDLKRRFADEKFRTAMRYKLAKINSANEILRIGSDSNFFGTASRIDKDGLIHPIFFSNTSLREVLGPKQGNLPQEIFDRLEAVFAPMISDQNYKYSFDLVTNLPLLTIERDNTYGATETFLIDDGRVMGGSTVSILGTYMTITGTTDTIFVDAKAFPDIAYNIINRSFYQLTPDEVYRAFSVMLQNYSIYNTIDFTNTAWFDYLTPTDKSKLTEHLTDILNFISRDPNLYYAPRLRFIDFADPDNFTLVSDSKVVSPFRNLGATSPEICEGLTFKVAAGQITQYFYTMPNATMTAGGMV